MILGIVGAGVVGGAYARAYSGFCEVRVYDVMPERATHPLPAVLDSDLIFVCLPTPARGDGRGLDTSATEEFFANTPYPREGRFKDRCFVLRSTVLVGFTRQMAEKHGLTNLCHSPEFLTARFADLDARMPARNIIGRADTYDDWIKAGKPQYPNKCRNLLYDLYHKRFNHAPIFEMTSDESEAVKLFQNAFSAVKIACFNEFRSYTDKMDMDWETVCEALLAGGFISPMHTEVPGPDGERGFGGACLPKDLACLAECMEEVGLGAPMLRAAEKRNRTVDR